MIPISIINELLNQPGNAEKVVFNQYHLVKRAGDPDKLYAIDLLEQLGQGSFANVYKAYPVDSATGKILFDAPLAAKLLEANKVHAEQFRQEVNIQMRYYGKTEAPLYLHLPNRRSANKDVIILFGDYLDAKQLGDTEQALAESTRSLSFSERVTLIRNLLMQFSLMHHNTPSTGSAIVHADIKGGNLLVKGTEIYPIDFGMSLRLENDDDIVATNLRGTPITMARELIKPVLEGERQGRLGTKSDIYALSAMIMQILGANSYGDGIRKFVRENCDPQDEMGKYKAIVEAQALGYTSAGMFDGLEVPDTIIDIKSLVNQFLTRMSHLDYNKRVNTDETLRFFTALDNFMQIIENEPHDQTGLNIQAAKMILLAEALWQTDLGRDPFDSVITTRTFEHVNFNDMPDVAHHIIALYEKEELKTSDTLIQLITRCEQQKLSELEALQKEAAALRERTLQRIKEQDAKTLNTVKEHYRSNYNASFFKNPWASTIGSRIMKDDPSLTLEDVRRYAKQFPTTRTAISLHVVEEQQDLNVAKRECNLTSISYG